MTEQALQQYLIKQYPKEDEVCEWKEFKNLKNDFSGHEKDDVISYVSALANMEGGHLVVGVEDKTLRIVGTDTYNYTTQQATLRLTNLCANLSSEGLDIEEFITEDTHKNVWVIHIPKHLPKLPVYAHNKAWQRIEDSLVELTPERLNAILEKQLFAPDDWSAGIVENATLADLDELAVAKARVMYKKVHSKIPANEIDSWSVEELLSNSGIYQISLGVAKITHQLPEYTRVSGLERSKLRQMTLQFIQNAGEDGTMRDGIYDFSHEHEIIWKGSFVK